MKKILIKNNILIAILILLLFAFSRGTVLGDQEKILSFVNYYKSIDISLYDFIFKSNGTCELYDKCNFNYLHHHLIWFFYLLILVNLSGFIELILGINLYNFEKELLVSLFDTLLFSLSFFFLIIKLNKFYSFYISFVTAGFIFFGSYGVNFINGGFSEILLIFLLVLKISNNQNSQFKPLTIAIIDILLIFIKLYSFIFVLLYLPLHFKKKKSYYLSYIKTFFPLLLLFITIKLNLPSDLKNYYQEGIDIDLIGILERVFNFYFSFSVGIWITFPIIILLLMKPSKIILYKFFIIFSLSLVFSLYENLAFWGGAGISGSRYIFPFLIIFADDIAKRISFIKIKYFFIISIFLYFPSINYKNTNILIVPETTGNMIISKVSDFPHYQFSLNPISLGWSSLIKQEFVKNNEIKININNKVYKVDNIVPDTLISKINFILSDKYSSHKITSRYENKVRLYKKEYPKLTNKNFNRFLRYFIYLSFISIFIIITFSNDKRINK